MGQPAHPTKRRRGRGQESGCEGWADLPHPEGQPHASQRRPRPLSSPICTGALGLGTTVSPLFSDKELGHRGLETTPRHQSWAHAPGGEEKAPQPAWAGVRDPLRGVSCFPHTLWAGLVKSVPERLLCPVLLLLTGLSLPHALKLLYADFTT